MREAYPLARAAALKALALDDTLGEAHTSLAAITGRLLLGLGRQPTAISGAPSS